MKYLTKNKNFLGLEEKYSSPENSKIIILPINYSNQKKKNEAKPTQLIFDASKKLEKYDEEMSSELCYEVGISTLKPISISSSNKNNEKLFNEFLSILNQKKILVTFSNQIVANDFVINLFSQTYNDFSILHLDSKPRLKNDWQTKNENEKFIRTLVEKNIDITQVGIRSISKEESDFKRENLVKQFLACEINLGMFGNDWQEMVVRNLKENVFVIFNLSVFDPIYFDNIEFPEAGGLNWNDIVYLFKIIGQDKNIIGIDFNGISYKKKSNSNYFIAKLLYKILNYTKK